MTLSDLQRHSPTASLFKYDFISTDIAELLDRLYDASKTSGNQGPDSQKS